MSLVVSYSYAIIGIVTLVASYSWHGNGTN